jgi:DNA-binding response OmpR family regulator
MEPDTTPQVPVGDQATAEMPAQPPVQAQPEAVTHTILIVEDDKVLQELYYDRFTAAGLTVVQAFDGLQALDRMESHPEIQLVLLDLMLPKMSGYDVLAQLKRSADKRDIPVIIVSALADVDDQARGLQLGAAEYITKGEMLPGVVIEKIKAYVLSVPGTAAV